MQYPQAYLDYLIEFHGTRDFFECHEIMEEYWKSQPKNEWSGIWVGLIQIVVGLYHHRRQNLTGAAKMICGGTRLLGTPRLEGLGIQREQFLAMLRERSDMLSRAVEAGEGAEAPYEDLSIPLQDRALEEICLRECARRGLIWGQASDLSEDALIHRHRLRDRSGVIAEREAQKLNRQAKRREQHES